MGRRYTPFLYHLPATARRAASTEGVIPPVEKQDLVSLQGILDHKVEPRRAACLQVSHSSAFEADNKTCPIWGAGIPKTVSGTKSLIHIKFFRRLMIALASSLDSTFGLVRVSDVIWATGMLLL